MVVFGESLLIPDFYFREGYYVLDVIESCNHPMGWTTGLLLQWVSESFGNTSCKLWSSPGHKQCWQVPTLTPRYGVLLSLLFSVSTSPLGGVKGNQPWPQGICTQREFLCVIEAGHDQRDNQGSGHATRPLPPHPLA